MHFHWRDEMALLRLRYDPIAPLLSSGDDVVVYFTRRDLLSEDAGPIETVWESPALLKLLKRQQPDGSWKGKKAPDIYPPRHYDLVETWRQFRFLIDQYGMTVAHPSARSAAEFLFSLQMEEGDIRGMLGNQYTMYYTGAILGLLIKAGYENDPRIEKGLTWLLSMRQDDGGWIATPIMILKQNDPETTRLCIEYAPPMPLDRTLPSSHNWTGMAIRAFAAHPGYRQRPEIMKAAGILKSRFFQEDCYTSYQSPDYWVRFQFPFWWNDLVSAMDSLSRIGIPAEDSDITGALDWFAANQQPDGLWNTDYRPRKAPPKGDKDRSMRLWVSFAICRILNRYGG
jgi:hypothetical protein